MVLRDKLSNSRMGNFHANHSTISLYRIYAILSLIIVCFTLCSWVDVSQVPVYDGVIRGSSPLSGSDIQYYLDSYSDLGISDTGSIFNNGSSVLHGAAMISGTEYNIRLFAGQLPEIEYNGSWITQEIIPEVTPPHYPVVVYFGAFIIFILIILVIFLIMRGFAI